MRKIRQDAPETHRYNSETPDYISVLGPRTRIFSGPTPGWRKRLQLVVAGPQSRHRRKEWAGAGSKTVDWISSTGARGFTPGDDDRTIMFTRIFENVGEAIWGMAYGRYECDRRGQAVELQDLFLLLCYMESVGLPNPAMAYLLELYPLLLDEFHLWHRRMGIDRSPLASFSCC